MKGLSLSFRLRFQTDSRKAVEQITHFLKALHKIINPLKHQSFSEETRVLEELQDSIEHTQR